jgi:hypothetical protein
MFKKDSARSEVVQTDAKENIEFMIQEKKLGHRVGHVFYDSSRGTLQLIQRNY